MVLASFNYIKLNIYFIQKKIDFSLIRLKMVIFDHEIEWMLTGWLKVRPSWIVNSFILLVNLAFFQNSQFFQ